MGTEKQKRTYVSDPAKWPGGPDFAPVEGHVSGSGRPPVSRQLYTVEERERRDSTIWTPIQGVLAAAQFLVFLVSLSLVIYFLSTGEGFWAASLSVLAKTTILLTIMITGAIWEKVVFGQYLFVDAFFWEDMVSMLVIALHLLYSAAFLMGLWDPATQMVIALAAYAAYLVNAGQFLLKFRHARLESERLQSPSNAQVLA